VLGMRISQRYLLCLIDKNEKKFDKSPAAEDLQKLQSGTVSLSENSSLSEVQSTC